MFPEIYALPIEGDVLEKVDEGEDIKTIITCLQEGGATI